METFSVRSVWKRDLSGHTVSCGVLTLRVRPQRSSHSIWGDEYIRTKNDTVVGVFVSGGPQSGSGPCLVVRVTIVMCYDLFHFYFYL